MDHYELFPRRISAPTARHQGTNRVALTHQFSLFDASDPRSGDTAVLAYLVPTFALGFVWHLVLFEQYYRSLQISSVGHHHSVRHPVDADPGWDIRLDLCEAFALSPASPANRTISYSLLGAILSWTFTTLAVAAKNIIVSVPGYLLIETGVTLVQWMMVAPLTVLRSADRRKQLRFRTQPNLFDSQPCGTN